MSPLRWPGRSRGGRNEPSGKSPRSDGLLASDVFVVSYPRSGNTLVRVMLANLLYGSGILDGLADLNRYVPDIYRGIPEGDHYSTPRVVKTHEPFAQRHGSDRPELYGKSIYVVRHPLDAIRSYFHYRQSRYGDFDLSIDEFALEVVDGARFPGSWNDHVLSWTRLEEREVLLLKYEDLLAGFQEGLARVAAFVDRDPEKSRLLEIEQACSLESMRELERRKPILSEMRSFVRETHDRRECGADLEEETVEVILSRSRRGMEEVGYTADLPQYPAPELS